MQIVVDIPEEMWERVKEGYVPLGISKHLRKGVPLPKGHDRLIDAGEYENSIRKHYFDNSTVIRCTEIALDNAPTIIEADKTRDCNNCAHSDQGRCAGTELCHECMWSNKFVEADTGSEDKG